MGIATELREAFRGRKVFVTGHTGFKGSWLTSWLQLLGAEVTGYALPPEPQASLFMALDLPTRIRHLEGDIRDLETLKRAMNESKAEVVFHLAAQPLVRRSYAQPRETFEVNTGGTVNVLEALRSFGQARAFVNITSDKCYDNREWTWGYRENDPLGGGDPYSASKACAELIFASYQKSFFPPTDMARHGLGAASARAGNVIGGGDWSTDRIVPDCIRALLAGQPISVRNADAVRPWQHVLESLSGYLLLAARLLKEPTRYGGAWNFGPLAADCRPVRDLVSEVVQAWQGGSWQSSVQADPAAPEAGLLRLCCDKAISQLGWLPVWNFKTAVVHTVAWYREYAKNCRCASALCRQQIEAYLAGLATRESSASSNRAAA